jgi:hypothetical protein
MLIILLTNRQENFLAQRKKSFTFDFFLTSSDKRQV